MRGASIVFVATLTACSSQRPGFVDLNAPPDDASSGSTGLEAGPNDAYLGGLGNIDVGSGSDGSIIGLPVCSDESTSYVYAVSEQLGLYRFAPASNAFSEVGRLDCPAALGSTPFSMAVARNGVAWILFDDGNVFEASVASAHCIASGYAPSQLGDTTFGMAFNANAVGSPVETLFVTPDGTLYGNTGPAGLATIDTTALTLHFIAPIGSDFGPAELTGRGDGRLFGFFAGEELTPVQPNRVAEIDPASGAIVSSNTLDSVTIGDGWAFAFWGGVYWLFTDPAGPTGGGSQITEYDYDTGATKVVLSGLGVTLVGAGVSTCAPTVGVVVN